MEECIIITNNPLVKGKIDKIKIRYCQDLEDVMTKTRDLVHLGHQLITHPLAGSVKPVQNPYRTIVISEEKGILDYRSLEIIERAIAKTAQFKKTHFPRDYPESILVDYQIIDFSLFESALKSLKFT